MRVERLEFREQSTENRLQSTAALRCVVFPERDICYQRRATPWTEYSCRADSLYINVITLIIWFLLCRI